MYFVLVRKCRGRIGRGGGGGLLCHYSITEESNILVLSPHVRFPEAM